MTEVIFPLEGKRIWVAGHRGMVGSAVVRRLGTEDCEILTVGRETLDLTEQAAVSDWLQEMKPDAVVLAAALVGGIHANNSRPAEFIRENLAIEVNVIHAAYETNVEKLLFLGSSCVYPRLAPQPMLEDALLGGPLEPTNQWYAIAKIAGIMMCQAYRRQYGCDFISAQPTNLYGPGDNFELASSHVLPALVRKFHEAKAAGSPSVTVWGSGTPLREFLHVDDLADSLVFLLKTYSGETQVNVGSGQEVSVRELAETIADVIDYHPELLFDSSKPDGMPRKIVDCTMLTKLGWVNARSLRAGIEDTNKWYQEHVARPS